MNFIKGRWYDSSAVPGSPQRTFHTHDGVIENIRYRRNMNALGPRILDVSGDDNVTYCLRSVGAIVEVFTILGGNKVEYQGRFRISKASQSADDLSRRRGDRSDVQLVLFLDEQPILGAPCDLGPPVFQANGREEKTVSRIIRDTDMTRAIKEVVGNRCQICGLNIGAESGMDYAEAHHLQPLGKGHDGPDVRDNIVVLCPNHHAMLDYAMMRITIANLKFSDLHLPAHMYVDYHNTRVAQAAVVVC